MAATPSIGSIGSKLDLLIKQGADFGPVTETLTNPDGSPVDLTGAVIRAQIRRSGAAAEAVGQMAVTITDALAGVFVWSLPSAATAAIAAGEKATDKASIYTWDMELVDAGGRVVPLHYGQVSVFREVTRG